MPQLLCAIRQPKSSDQKLTIPCRPSARAQKQTVSERLPIPRERVLQAEPRVAPVLPLHARPTMPAPDYRLNFTRATLPAPTRAQLQARTTMPPPAHLIYAIGA